MCRLKYTQSALRILLEAQPSWASIMRFRSIPCRIIQEGKRQVGVVQVVVVGVTVVAVGVPEVVGVVTGRGPHIGAY